MRTTLVRECVQVGNRLRKVLEDANLKLDSVATDALGVWGRTMIQALIEGRDDPAELAALARGRLRAKLPELQRALEGRVTAHHRFLLSQERFSRERFSREARDEVKASPAGMKMDAKVPCPRFAPFRTAALRATPPGTSPGGARRVRAPRPPRRFFHGRVRLQLVRTPLTFLLFAAAALAAEPNVIPLWPGAPPGTPENWTQPEQEAVGPKDTIRRVSNVTRPTLTVHVPAAGANGTAMIVCPGGGFRILAIDHEGHQVARWLNSIGVTAFVLKYRVMPTVEGVPAAEQAERRKLAMALGAADGQQAVRLVRSRAAEWGIAPDRIGIMGFSAGGYVTAAVALGADPASRPNFAAPIYPATPQEVAPPAGAPPLFLVHADDDKTVPAVSHSVRLYSAWKQAQIPAELHIYSRGGHGFGMSRKGLPVDSWPDRLRDWLALQGLLERASR